MSDQHPLEGGCLCRTVGWRLSAEPTPMAHCHCSVCRKMHGTAFATFMAADGAAVSFTRGEEAVTEYQSSPGFRRRFCSVCGSALPGMAPDGHAFVPAGGLDGDPGTRPKIHIFVPSRALWYEIEDNLRQFDTFPRGPGPASLSWRGGQTRAERASGACNCGGVHFELTGPIHRAHHCHCSRCRKARAAAHASNGFADASALGFTRGEPLVRLFKLPGARHFAQAFCTRCGSKLPRVDAGRALVVVPLGGLDKVPDARPSEHIHCASRAPWFDIPGGAPRHDEAAPTRSAGT